MKRHLLTIFLLILSYSLLAQTNCERNLNEARANFTNGNLYAIPGQLTDCLEEGFSKSEKIEAYRLLTLTYLNINQQEKARESFIKLLKLKTDYQVVEGVDPPELFSLYRKIDTKPIYFIGLSGGLNYNTIQLPNNELDRYTTNSGEDDHNYSGSVSWQAGAQFIYPVLDNVWLSGGLAYQNQRYKYGEKILNNEDPEKYTEISYESSNNGINLNLGARGIMDYYYWKPYAGIGVTARYNLTHFILDYNSASVNPNGRSEEIIPRTNMEDYRKAFNIGMDLYLGTIFKIWTYYGEISIGATKYFIEHTNYENDTQREIRTVAGSGHVIEDNYVNIVYQVNLSFNIPFFNFK